MNPVDSRPPKKCSGCSCLRYDSTECLHADWKAHCRGCRAIAAELGAKILHLVHCK